jgi:dethiobiotin synthetase
MSTALFVTGTDTNVGKTVLSALLCAALDGIYWKPVQTGAREGIDREAVCRWAELPHERTVPECYSFEPPVSPHLAASLAGSVIDLAGIEVPSLEPGNPLIIEGAGGVLVPLNHSDLMLDLMCKMGAPVVIAARTTLGTINHTLLTVNAIRARELSIKGVVMIGNKYSENERAIEHYGDVPVIGRIPLLEVIHRQALLRVFNSEFHQDAFRECLSRQ